MDSLPSGESSCNRESPSASTIHFWPEALESKRLELRHRWSRGERVGAETLFEPSMDREWRLRLIVAELLLREEYEEPINLEDLEQRFGEFREEVRRQVDFLRLISRERANTPAQAAPRIPHAAGSVHILGYQIRDLIARGGMGAVYLGWEEQLKRLVALKLMLQGDSVSPQSLERFRKEAQAVAQLNHTNIVKIYHVGEWQPPGTQQSSPFFAMEFCSGGDFARKLAKTPQEPRRAAQWVATLARAIHHAHEAGIIHRDLKPSNILITQDDQLKITDFGLAKQRDVQDGQTATGTVMGTPAYMAPEQTSGRKETSSPSVDIYSLGAILYEMLTGRPPFQGTNVVEVLEQVRSREPLPPRSMVPGIPTDLESIVLKCLNKSPRLRYATAADLANDLEQFLAGRPTVARPITTLERGLRWVQRNQMLSALIGVTFAALLLIVGLTTWYLTSLGDAERDRQMAQRNAQVQHYFELLAKMNERTARPTAGWTWQNLEAIREAMEIQQKYNVQTTQDSEEALRSVALDALVAVDAREKSLLFPGRRFDSLAWSPDGKRLALGGRSFILFPWCDVYLVDPHYPDRRKTISVWCNWPRDKGWFNLRPNAVHSLAYSPDGRWLAFALRSDEAFVVDLHQPQPRPVRLEGVSFPHHGSLIFNTTGQTLLWWSREQALYWEVGTWKLLHREKAREHLLQVHADSLGGFQLAARGYLYAVDGRGQLLRPSLPGHVHPWSQLPDGRTLALEYGDRISVRDRDLRHNYQLIAPRRRTSHDSEVSVSWDARGHLALSLDSSNRLARLWDLNTASIACDLHLPGSPGINACAMAPDGRHFAVLEYLGARLFEIRPRPEFDLTAMQVGELVNLSTHPEHAWIATAARFEGELVNEVRVLDPTRPSQVRYRSILQPLINSRISPLKLTGETPRVLRIGWHDEFPGMLVQDDIFSPRPALRTPLGPGYGTADLSLGQDSSVWVAFLHEMKRIEANGKTTVRWINDYNARFGSNPGLYDIHTLGNLVAVGCRNGSTSVFNVKNNEAHPIYGTLTSYTPVTKVRLAEAGRSLIVGRINGQLEIHDLQKKELVHTYSSHQAEITGLVLTPDGLLISSSQQGEILFWSFQEGMLTPLARHRGPPQRCQLALAADGVTLYSLHENDHGIRVWHLERLLARWAELGLGRNLPTPRARRILSAPLEPPTCPPLTPQSGWHGELYRLTGFLGPLQSQANAQLDFSPSKPPLAKLPAAPEYSGRWTGWVVPPKAGRHKIRLQSNCPATVWLDNQRRIEYVANGSNDWAFEVDLELKPYALRLEAPKMPLNATLRLSWSGPGQPMDIPLGTPHVFSSAPLAQEHARKLASPR